MEYFKRASKFTTEHSAIVSLLAAVAPFLYVSIATIIFAEGNSKTANYIFQNYGLFEIWTSGLIDILHFIFLIGIGLFLVIGFRKFINLNNTEGYYNYYYGAAFAIFLGIVPLSIVIGLTFGLIVKEIKRRRKKKSQSETNPVGYFIFLGALILYFSIINFPNLPYSKLSIENNITLTGKVISDKGDQIIIVEKDNNKLRVLKQSQVNKTEICTIDKSWLSKSLLGILSKEKLLNEC